MNFKKNINFLIFLSLAFVFADDDGDLTIISTNNIPFCTSWANDGGSPPDWSTIDINSYDAGYKEFAGMLIVTDFDANYAFNISASKSDWTLPDGYDETNGAKRSNGSDSDFLIKVSAIDQGTGVSGGLTVSNGHDDYQAVTKSGTEILTGGSTSSSSAHGVETAQFTIDGKVLLDWSTDIPGDYELTITLSITSQ